MAENRKYTPSPQSNCVGLFVTCLADIFRPSVAVAAVKLLNQYGMNVSVPVQSCCGQPAYNSGELEKTVVLAKQFVTQFESFDYIVAPSGSCAAMVKIHYPDILANHGEWADRSRKVASKTWELSVFLTEVLSDDVGFDAAAIRTPENSALIKDRVVSYHDSCSGLRELGIRTQPRKLLKKHCGIEITEMNNSEICCGFGGTFCLKYPEISTRLVDNKIEGLDDSEADVLVGGDLGCLMNISGRLRRLGKHTKVYHYAEILANEMPDEESTDKK